MTRRLTQRGKDRRIQLMDYAARKFAANGYHPTSVAEIVEGLGVGKGVFYWYFSSKEELFLDILRDAQLGMRRAQDSAIGEEADPVSRIELGIRASIHWLADNRHLLTLFQFAATEDRFSPELRRGGDVALADVVRHVKEGIVAGRIRDADPEVMAQAIVGVTNTLARRFLFGRGEAPDDVADAAIAFCLEGLLPRA